MFTQPPTKRRGFYILCKKFAFWRKLLYNICRQQKHKQIQHVANSTMLKKFFTSPRSIPIWFLAVILVGSALLSLPISSVASPPKYIDALFTSVSAVCVTGLITVDTATQWSLFGQIVILLLLQIGGMGVVTIAMVFHLIFHQRIGLGQRNLMQESISAHELGGIVRFTRFIIVGIITVELVGAIAMCPIFIADFGWGEGIWKAIFHSVSAFCNAGFDIMGTTEAKFVSLTRYVANPVINITVIMLIVAGGLGFLTWQDIAKNGVHVKRYRTQSKLILVTTAILIVLPAVYFFFADFGNMPFGQRLLASLFAAVSPRTAGFSTTDYNNMSEVGIALTDILMLIGGSPGSTAGGMKTTTAALLLLTVASVLRKKEEVSTSARRFDDFAIKSAITLLVIYFTTFFVGGAAISLIENLPLTKCLFEAASALGTVGLTMGITPTLGIASKIILMAMMFAGRIGALTLFYAALQPDNGNYRLPQEKITVG